MIMRYSVQLSAAKNYILGFLTSALLLVSGLYYYNYKNPNTSPEISFTEKNETEQKKLSDFNPNDLTEEGWKELGFSDKQTATILKYKSVVGGNFSSKEQFKKCYAVSPEKYQELEPYLILPDGQTKQSFSGNYRTYSEGGYDRPNYPKTSTKELKIPGKFNPDTYTAEDFIRLGFSEKQALSIIKYKNYLGGSFISKEKFKECYTVSDANYLKLAPYLLLPEKGSVNHSPKGFSNNYSSPTVEKPKITYEPFDPNTTDLAGWQKLGFSPKQAQVIINYRDKNLKGQFKSLEEIASCFVISAEKFETLKPYIVLNGARSTSQSASKSDDRRNIVDNQRAAESDSKTANTNFSITDLNEIKFKQLIEYGFDEKSAASLIGFRNKLGGFMNKKQIIETYNIDKDLAEKLVNSAPLRTENVNRYAFMDAPESWLKNHPYFKYYADKIIYYRITYSDEKKFFRTMKIKPEAEEKMRWYLK